MMKQSVTDVTVSQLAEKRQPYWLSLRALPMFDKMPSWDVVRDRDLLTIERPDVRFFISHPWITPCEPDPDGTQWRALNCFLKTLLKADPHPEAWFPLYYMPEGLESAAAHIYEVFRIRSIPSSPLREAGRIRQSIMSVYHVASRELGDVDTPKATSPRRTVGIWLDYCCLPQGARTADEQAYFVAMLPALCSLATSSILIPLWPDETQQRTRAWCMAEATLFAIVTERPILKPSCSLWDEAKEIHVSGQAVSPSSAFAAVDQTTDQFVAEIINTSRQAASPAVVAQFLQSNGAHCSITSDITIVATALWASGLPIARLGMSAVILKCLQWVFDWLWRITALLLLPVVACSAFLAWAQRRMDGLFNYAAKRSAHAHALEPVLFYCVLIVYILITFILAIPVILGMLCLYVVLPVKAMVTSSRYRIERIRSEFVATTLRDFGDWLAAG